MLLGSSIHHTVLGLMGASVVLALTILAITGTVPARRVLSGFSNPTLWLIFTAIL